MPIYNPPASGGITSVTASAPLYSSGGASPNITIVADANNSIYIGGGGTVVTSATYNLSLGALALHDVQSGSSNFALGPGTLQYNISGSNNTAIGPQALNYLRDSNNNIAIGFNACLTEHGWGNVAIGYSSMGGGGGVGDYNVGIGGYTIPLPGTKNVAIGLGAGQSINGQNYNTFIGVYAGVTNTGDASVMIGYNAGYNETGSNKLYIANSSTATPLIYGEFDTVRVGIGIVATAKLHLPASDGGASNAPLKFTAGTLLGTPEVGAMEFVDDGTNGHLYITRHIAGILTRSLII